MNFDRHMPPTSSVQLTSRFSHTTIIKLSEYKYYDDAYCTYTAIIIANFNDHRSMREYRQLDSYRQNHIYTYVIMSNVNFEFLKCHENAWYVSLDNLNRL